MHEVGDADAREREGVVAPHEGPGVCEHECQRQVRERGGELEAIVGAEAQVLVELDDRDVAKPGEHWENRHRAEERHHVGFGEPATNQAGAQY